MNKRLKTEIRKNPQIIKFSFYGFLKNLKFFEPYLYIYLISCGINLFQIGILISIREITINIFEVPSGLISDFFGRKKELYLCFIFYIISFFLFYSGASFFVIITGMIFFGLGEAFRSGTHKAMIYSYLEQKGWQEYKTFVYGKTRSMSLTGSAISAVLSIILILCLPANRFIFLVSTLPLILDFILISTYPNSLDKCDVNHSKSKKQLIKESFAHLWKGRILKKLLIGNGMFEASVSCIQSLIQPILKVAILGSGYIIIAKFNAQDNVKIFLGLIYSLFYIISSFASKNAYKIKSRFSGEKILNVLYLLLATGLLVLSFLVDKPMLIILTFIFIFCFQNIRTPVYIDIIGSYMQKYERATFLSISSQIKSLLTVIIAPVIGFIAERMSLSCALITLAMMLLITFIFSGLTEECKV